MNPTTFRILTAAALAAFALPGRAAIAVGDAGSFSYSQNFNSLPISSSAGNWSNDATLPGWSTFAVDGSPDTVYLSGTGSVTTGHIWNFASTTSSTERALGGHTTAAYSGGSIAVAFTNTSGVALPGLTINFDGEQYRNGGSNTAQGMVLSWGIGASYDTVATWTTPGGNFDFIDPVRSATAGVVNGNVAGLTANHGGTITADWQAGDTLWIKWTLPAYAGTNNTDSIAIDNFSASIAAVPEPGSWALMAAGLGVMGFIARRRKA